MIKTALNVQTLHSFAFQLKYLKTNAKLLFRQFEILEISSQTYCLIIDLIVYFVFFFH